MEKKCFQSEQPLQHSEMHAGKHDVNEGSENG